MSEFEYKQDGEEAKRIASVIPYYPFHGIDRFYGKHLFYFLNFGIYFKALFYYFRYQRYVA